MLSFEEWTPQIRGFELPGEEEATAEGVPAEGAAEGAVEGAVEGAAEGAVEGAVEGAAEGAAGGEAVAGGAAGGAVDGVPQAPVEAPTEGAGEAGDGAANVVATDGAPSLVQGGQHGVSGDAVPTDVVVDSADTNEPASIESTPTPAAVLVGGA